MSPEDHFPPPGSAPPPGPPPGQAPGQPPGQQGPPAGPPGPGWAPYPTGPVGGPPPGWAPPPPGYATGAAHKPGALPLRPLRLGDIYDAAFKIIRYNPKATVGSAVLVAAAAMAVPVVVTAVLSVVLDLSLATPGGSLLDSPATGGAVQPSASADLVGVVVAYGSLFLGSFAQSIGLLFVTGMVAHVTAAAAVGRRLSLGEAWAATAGRRWHLVGLSLLVGLVFVVAITAYVLAWVLVVIASDSVAPVVVWGLVSVPAFIALCVWLWMRFNYLAVPALMLERTGVFAALGRSFRLTRKQFWRTFGIALLTLVIVQIAGSILTTPITLLSGLASLSSAFAGYELLVTVVGQALATIVASAFVSPFSAAVASLQYVDQRMRKEAYDVELMSQAGITGA